MAAVAMGLRACAQAQHAMAGMAAHLCDFAGTSCIKQCQQRSAAAAHAPADPAACCAPAVVINFFAPWCHWCQRLSPTWEASTKEVHDKYPEWDGRIRYAKVDCTEEVQLCRDHFITGFPSLRWGHAGCSCA